MSSGVPARTDRPSSRSVALEAVTTEPNALNRMFGRERPIAALIILVSRMPDAPTRVPATMRRFEPIVNPEAATASPVNELSSEMSTGTSAPPIGQHEGDARAGRTSASRIQSHASDPVTSSRIATVTTATPSRALSSCWAG